jgi:tRNA(Arg) A34 adenosine deaminase TadA
MRQFLSGTQHIAWIRAHTGTFWFASGDGPLVARLVTGIYENEKFEAWRTLRQRIYVTRDVTPFEAALVRVCAKRVSVAASVDDFSAAKSNAQRVVDVSSVSLADPVAARDVAHLVPHRLVDTLDTGSSEALAAAMAVNQDFAATIPLDPDLFSSPRPVAASLISSSGEWLAAAVNSNGVVRTRHAELNLVFNWFATSGRKIPAGAVLITSLSPCRMCAALLAEMAEDGADLVVWSQREDTGRLGRQNSLRRVTIFTP